MRLIILLIFITVAYTKERDYQDIFCKKSNGVIEYRLKDRRRVDCLTNRYAIEVDFAYKYRDAISQSLEYAMDTNHKAGILLIIKNREKDKKYLKRLNKFLKFYNLDIKIWTIDSSFKIDLWQL
jgi:hypothetical protein